MGMRPIIIFILLNITSKANLRNFAALSFTFLIENHRAPFRCSEKMALTTTINAIENNKNKYMQ
jgi:hypothetical protein